MRFAAGGEREGDSSIWSSIGQTKSSADPTPGEEALTRSLCLTSTWLLCNEQPLSADHSAISLFLLKVLNYVALAVLNGEECARAMPRFHFGLVNGQEALDTGGKVLPDKKSARKEAEAMLEGFKSRWRSVRIRDAAGNLVEIVSIEEDEEER